MNEYVIIPIRTDKGMVWDVRKRGRLLWKELGRFKSEAEAEKAASEDMGGNGGSWQYSEVIDRRSRRKRGFHVWVLEYNAFYLGGQFYKEREEFLTKWGAQLHKWLYHFDSSKSKFRIFQEERGV